MATTQVTYSSNQTITISPASLASSSTFISGVESDQVDNTTNRYVDCLVQGKATIGTSATAGTNICVWVWGSDTSLATTAIDALDGTASAESLTNAGVLYAALKLGAIATNQATASNVTYHFAPFSVAQLFGGVMPKYWGLFLSHNTGVALNGTGSNHAFSYVGVKYDIA